MRAMLVFGLILLAAFLPLAVLAIPVRAVDALTLVSARFSPPIRVDVSSVALLALTPFRAPPSR
jgi:hypothetical protein